MRYPYLSTDQQGEDKQAKLFSEPHSTSQIATCIMWTADFTKKTGGRKRKEWMNINIKYIKINRSGQRDQKRWVFKRLWSHSQPHFLFLIWMCNQKMATKSLQGQPQMCVCSEAHSPDAAIQRHHKVSPTSSFIFLHVWLQFLNWTISPHPLKKLLNYPYRQAPPESNGPNRKSSPL